jgi:hypothetical protein
MFYDFVFTADDPEGDQIWYEIRWGDGVEIVDGPYSSGTSKRYSHKWNITGDIIIEARAKDSFDYYGEWAEYAFTVPRYRTSNIILLDWLFEQFPYALKTIRYLLNLRVLYT